MFYVSSQITSTIAANHFMVRPNDDICKNYKDYESDVGMVPMRQPPIVMLDDIFEVTLIEF